MEMLSFGFTRLRQDTGLPKDVLAHFTEVYQSGRVLFWAVSLIYIGVWVWLLKLSRTVFHNESVR